MLVSVGKHTCLKKKKIKKQGPKLINGFKIRVRFNFELTDLLKSHLEKSIDSFTVLYVTHNVKYLLHVTVKLEIAPLVLYIWL